MKPDCANCLYLSQPVSAMRCVCQRATSEHYATAVLQKGISVCDQWEHWTGRKFEEQRVVIKFPGAA